MASKASQIITKEMWDYHFEINRVNAETCHLDADAVLIHDPQPVPLIEFKKGGQWIWRCHINVSSPVKEVWGHLLRYCGKYGAAIFSVEKFAQSLAVDQFVIPPAIDP